MKRLLWFGDACCSTGFATVTHSVLEHLRHKWDVHVCGINYRGDPHSYPYPVYPADIRGDIWGVRRFDELCDKVKPDVVLINNDSWNIVRFPYHVKTVTGCDPKVPIVGYVPVDGTNFHKPTAERLNQLAACIWYTEFGKIEAETAGYSGKSYVIPHGVHPRYVPMDKKSCRKSLGLPDAYIVGNVNRNSLRKRLDITMRAFKDFLCYEPSAFLYLHCKVDDEGLNVDQYAEYLGISKHVICPAGWSTYNGFREDEMPLVYNSFDMQVTTSMGEGWGLTTHEGMACGVPQVLPCHSALKEWCLGIAEFCYDMEPFIAPYGVNLELMAVKSNDFQDAMVECDKNFTEDKRTEQVSVASGKQYQWPAIAEQFHQVLASVIG